MAFPENGGRGGKIASNGRTPTSGNGACQSANLGGWVVAGMLKSGKSPANQMHFCWANRRRKKQPAPWCQIGHSCGEGTGDA